MAWTITETKDAWASNILGGNELIEIVLSCTSDASSTDYDLTNIDYLKGSSLYLVKVIPGTGGDQPSGTFDLDVEDEDDDHILDTDANANDATTFHPGANTLGVYAPIKSKCSVVIATLGDGNKATVKMLFVR